MTHITTYHNVYVSEESLIQPFKMFYTRRDCVWDLLETQDKDREDLEYLYTVETVYPLGTCDPSVTTSTYCLESAVDQLRQDLEEEAREEEQYEEDVRREYYSVIL